MENKDKQYKIKVQCKFCDRLVCKYGMKRHQQTFYCLSHQPKI